MTKNVYEVSVRKATVNLYRVEAASREDAMYEVQRLERDGKPPIDTKSTWDVMNIKPIKEMKSPAEGMDRFERSVVCEWCGNKYRSVAPNFDDPDKPSTTQGDDCCAHVYYKDGTWYAVGGYGSGSYDMEIYRFVQNEPTKAARVVCDNCIGERISYGDLVREGTDEP